MRLLLFGALFSTIRGQTTEDGRICFPPDIFESNDYSLTRGVEIHNSFGGLGPLPIDDRSLNPLFTWMAGRASPKDSIRIANVGGTTITFPTIVAVAIDCGMVPQRQLGMFKKAEAKCAAKVFEEVPVNPVTGATMTRYACQASHNGANFDENLPPTLFNPVEWWDESAADCRSTCDSEAHCMTIPGTPSCPHMLYDPTITCTGYLYVPIAFVLLVTPPTSLTQAVVASRVGLRSIACGLCCAFTSHTAPPGSRLELDPSHFRRETPPS